jgi:hypothetical protein
MRATVISALSLILAAGAAAPVHAATAALAPHRAVYDLALAEASDRSGITGLTGRMVYEFDGSACDGYTVNFRFVTRIDTAESSRISDMQSTTYEDGSGSSFDFATKSYLDQTLDKEIRGRATTGPDGTKVNVEKPAPQNVELDPSHFPTQHLVDLIARANSGETFYETTIFDGSEDADRLMTTTVVIGHKSPVEQADAELANLGPLAKDQYWPVDIAYFDLTEGEEVPSYRISFKLHENGFTRDLLMDYGDFAMTGKLVQLEMLDAPASCPTR